MEKPVPFSIAKVAYLRARSYLANDNRFTPAERLTAGVQMRKKIATLVREGSNNPLEIANLVIGEARQTQQVERSRRVVFPNSGSSNPNE